VHALDGPTPRGSVSGRSRSLRSPAAPQNARVVSRRASRSGRKAEVGRRNFGLADRIVVGMSRDERPFLWVERTRTRKRKRSRPLHRRHQSSAEGSSFGCRDWRRSERRASNRRAPRSEKRVAVLCLCLTPLFGADWRTRTNECAGTLALAARGWNDTHLDFSQLGSRPRGGVSHVRALAARTASGATMPDATNERVAKAVHPRRLNAARTFCSHSGSHRGFVILQNFFLARSESESMPSYAAHGCGREGLLFDIGQ
jgi:hypothetical protein